LLALLAAFIIVACGFSGLGEGETSYSQADEVIAKYEKIGKEHNALLEEYHASLSKSRNAGEEDALFAEFFGITEESQFVYVTPNLSSGRSVEKSETLVAVISEQSMIDSKAAVYMMQIENLLENPPNDFQQMQDSITAIERNAVESLDDIALDEFMAYAETAKSSLEFWAVHYESLVKTGDLSDNNSENTRGLFDWISSTWKKYKNKLAMMAASDAAGAAAGAAVGAGIGSSIPGVGTAAGATAGAIVCGTASSEEGFRTGKLCVIVDITAIQKRLKK
jgi:hypothetical protein